MEKFIISVLAIIVILIIAGLFPTVAVMITAISIIAIFVLGKE